MADPADELAALRAKVELLELRAELQTKVMRAALVALASVDADARAFVDRHIEGLIGAIPSSVVDEPIAQEVAAEARRFLAAGRAPDRPRFGVVEGGRAASDPKGAS